MPLMDKLSRDNELTHSDKLIKKQALHSLEVLTAAKHFVKQYKIMSRSRDQNTKMIDRYLPFRINGYSILTAIPPQKIPGPLAGLGNDELRWLLPVVLGSAEAAPILSGM